MKLKADERGEIEGHPAEYAPAGPVKVATLADRKASRSTNELISALFARVIVLEEQVALLQMAAPRGIPKP